MKPNKPSSLCLLALAALSASTVFGQVDQLPTSRTAGLIQVDLPINQISLVSLPLVDVVSSGTITSVSGTTLGVSSTLGTLTGPHAIKITSRDDQRGTGANAPSGSSTNAYGITVQISSSTSSAVTTASAITPNVGDEFIIYPLDTLATLFGAPPTGGWNLSSGSGSADIVYLDVAGVLTGYFYKNGGFGGNGWKTVAAPTGSAVNGTVILPNRGVLVQRRNTGTAFSLRSTGVTMIGRETAAVVAGFNIINNPFTVSTTLSASGLLSYVTGSTGAASADAVYLENSGVLTGYFYKNAGLGGTGWRLVSGSAANQGSVMVTPGKAILFEEKAGTVGFSLPEPFAE